MQQAVAGRQPRGQQLQCRTLPRYCFHHCGLGLPRCLLRTPQDQRRRLPIYQHRTEILYLLETHATTVVVGETGSGKTTQIPQYLHEAGEAGYWCRALLWCFGSHYSNVLAVLLWLGRLWAYRQTAGGTEE